MMRLAPRISFSNTAMFQTNLLSAAQHDSHSQQHAICRTSSWQHSSVDLGMAPRGFASALGGKAVSHEDGREAPPASGNGGGNEKKCRPTLSPFIQKAFAHPLIHRLVKRTLAEDLDTCGVDDAQLLADLTMQSLTDAHADYPAATEHLAFKVYNSWRGQRVRDLYHDYNWRVERAGSAEAASRFLRGKSHVDIGGGVGTFALELMRQESSQDLSVTVADIADYRNEFARAHPRVSFDLLEPGKALPFGNNAFDSGSLLYVLHHVESDHFVFLKECARCVRDTLLLFEDVKVDTRSGVPSRAFRPSRALESDFLGLSLEEQNLFIVAIDYICNHLVSQALGMPVPGKYYEFTELECLLKEIFPSSKVTKRYHGIYDAKCFPNPEAMYIVAL